MFHGLNTLLGNDHVYVHRVCCTSRLAHRVDPRARDLLQRSSKTMMEGSMEWQNYEDHAVFRLPRIEYRDVL
jgi:hypothetical protein